MLIEERTAYDYEWTGLNHRVSQYILDNGPNPLEGRLESEILLPGAREALLMHDSKYMYFTAKMLLDMDLMPFQSVLLDMFWRHSSPMLIGSRGLGKCVVGDTVIVTDRGFKRINEVVSDSVNNRQYSCRNLRLLGEFGYNSVDYGFCNGISQTRVLTTEHGIKLEGTLNHPVRIMRDDERQWVNMEDVKVGDIIPVHKNYSWTFDNDYWPEEAYEDGRQFNLRKELWGASKTTVSSFMDGVLYASTKVNAFTYLYDGPHIEDIQFFALAVGIMPRNVGGKLLLDTANKERSVVRSKITSITSSYNKTYDVHMQGKDHSFITNGLISHNSSIAAIYSIIRAFLYPGTKIVVAGSAFRQSKFIFDYIEAIWDKAPVLQSLCDNKSGPKKSQDMYQFHINNSTIYTIPIGCLTEDTLITGENGIKSIRGCADKTIWCRDRFKEVGFRYEKGLDDVMTVTTYGGFTYTGTHNHKMKCLLKEKEQWVRTDEMHLGSQVLIDISERWFNHGKTIDPEYAYKLASVKKDEFPEELLSANKEAVQHYLSGLFDKYAEIDSLAKDTQIILNYHSKKFLTTVQYILTHFGIFSKLENDITSFNLVIASDFIGHFIKRIGFSNKKKDNLIGMLAYKYSFFSGSYHKDIYYDTVVDIERHQEKELVFDFNVPDDHMYTAGGFVSHNTGEKIRGLRGNVVIADEFNCLAPNTLVETDKGLLKIKDSFDRQDFALVNKNGEYEYPDKYITTPKKVQGYKVKTKYGYTFTCSKKHKVMTIDGWKGPKELTDKDFLVFDNKYKFPSKSPKGIDAKMAWFLGILLAEGSVVDARQIQIKNTDKDLIDRIINYLRSINIDFSVQTFDAYKDPRGWNCKPSYNICISNKEFRTKLSLLGLDYKSAINKTIPWSILQSSKSDVISFLSGLWEGDGTFFLFDKNRLGASYYTASSELADDLHVLLSKLDILAQKQPRKSKISNNPQWMIRLNGPHAIKFGKLLNVNKFNSKVEACYRPDKQKNGTVFLDRSGKYQAKFYYAKKDRYIGQYNTASEARNAIQSFKESHPDCLQVKSVELVDDLTMYDYHAPDTHSFYGAGFIQHNSIDTQIYEVVIKNFGVVNLDPINSVKRKAKLKQLERMGLDIPIELQQERFQNQSIIMGTMGFEFEPLFEYWEKYKKIIASKGVGEDGTKMKSWKEFAIMRMPFDLIPEGFMAENTIEAAKATMHTAYYNSEFGCVPVKDTTGFFKRSVIEACVAKPSNIQDSLKWPSWCPSVFDAKLTGDKKAEYIMGIDPAAEEDNFAIVILEVHPEHSRVVYCWTVNKKQLGDKVKNYYAYCARKVRALQKAFNIKYIGIDAQGGGNALAEALQDEDKLESGEVPLWPVILDDKKQDTDGYAGDHILYMIQFASSEWTAVNNHGLLKDLQSKTLLFPNFNSVLLGTSSFEEAILDIEKSIYSDSLEDCLLEIEDLKKELSIIAHTKTGSRERWDTPEIKTAENKKIRLKKDRYSALLIANSIAREYSRNTPIIKQELVGGKVGDISTFNTDDPLYTGPAHKVSHLSPEIFRAVNH